jgi:hypothetical protein
MAGPCEAQNGASVEFALRNAFVQEKCRGIIRAMKRLLRTTPFLPPRPPRGRVAVR